MKGLKNYVLLFSVLIWVLSFCTNAFARGTENIMETVNTASANVGDTIQLQLQTNDMTVSSFTCGVEFDPEVLSVVSVTESPTIETADGGTWRAIAASAPEQANASGTVGFAFANSEERAYIGGTMATVTFEVLSAGSTEIVLYEDSDGLNGRRSDAVETIDCFFGGGGDPEEMEIVLDEQTDTYATITVTNCSDGELTAYIVVAAYDMDGKQVGNAVAREMLAPQTPVEATVGYATAADKIKVFLLDPVSLRPLNAAKQLPKE